MSKRTDLYQAAFTSESQDILETINQSLLSLEKEPHNTTLIDEVFRAAHSLKGMSAAMNFDGITALAHEMENILDKVRKKEVEVSLDIVDTLFEYSDALEGLVGEITGQRKEKTEKAHLPVVSKETQSVRISTERLNSLMNLAGELLIAKNRLKNIAQEYKVGKLDEALAPFDRLVADLEEEVLKTRLVPVGQTFGRFPRMVRDIAKEERKEIEDKAKKLVDFGKIALGLWDDLVMKNKELADLITGDTYYHETYYMGMVDENDKVNFYEGKIKVVDPDGKEYVKFDAKDYLDYIAETVKPWTYLKFPYLKGVGWKGLVDGKDSGIYRVNSLARLNVADGMATPAAQKAYDEFYDFFGKKPVHNTLAFNWARIIENLYAAERCLELIQDPEITSDDIRGELGEPGEGVGCVEAPRGTLFHHYWADKEGMTKKVNLIVATGQNNGPMCMSVKKAAERLIKNWKVEEGLLNMVEMAFRAYDPCIACATHSLPGQMPLEVDVYDPDGNVYQQLGR